MSDLLNAVAASDLVNGALLAALIPALVQKGVISADEAREIYEQALLMLEAAQAASPASQEIFAVARELIEQNLRAQQP